MDSPTDAVILRGPPAARFRGFAVRCSGTIDRALAFFKTTLAIMLKEETPIDAAWLNSFEDHQIEFNASVQMAMSQLTADLLDMTKELHQNSATNAKTE